jgi:cell division protein FtsB
MLLRALRHGHQQGEMVMPFSRALPGATVALPSAGLGDIAMPKMTFAAAVTLALCCASSPVSAEGPAQDGTSPAGPSRYSFNRVDNGFLRLDNQSGQVAYCGQHVVGWACEAVPEDRAALEKEIARLQDAITSLKREVASLREPSPPRPPGELSPPAENRDDAAKLREDMERARAALEHAWRGLVDMIITFQKDMMRKG